ncbi:MAG: transglutaminase-like domain-containing protein, partial [Marinilabiliaceae bacterium]
MEEDLQVLYNESRFQTALDKIDSMRQEGHSSFYADSLEDYMTRYYKAYPYSRSEIVSLIEEKDVSCSGGVLDRWEEAGYLEFRVIDGEKRYFENAVYNLFLLNDSLRQKVGLEGLNKDSLGRFCVKHIGKILTEYDSQHGNGPLHPVDMILNYQVKLDSGVTPPGALISAWLPFGVRDCPRQSDVKLIRTRPDDSRVSPADCAHQSVYLEQKAKENGPTSFSTAISMTGNARYVPPSRLSEIEFVALPDSVKSYAEERPPHIVFTEDIRQLADSLVTPKMKPFDMVREFYYWINDHIPWASAVEYALMENIPQYTLDHGHGDCGMQTLLFMTLCRSKGIPARWQSGWMLHPGHVNLHDWCEVWYDGIGWVPVDVSFKLQESDDPRIREFYLSGIDAFRFIVNKDYGRQFCPQKKWPRSEPWDFQRGELEWAGGNLYFDQWSWDMEVKYV